MKPIDRVHEGIATLVPYAPGKPIEDVARERGLTRIVKLASNENPLGPSPKAIEAVRRAATDMHRYPDGPGRELVAALHAHHGVDPATVVLGNGSNELLELALRTFVRPGEIVASAAVTFSVYGILAQAHGAGYVTAPMDGVAYDLPALSDLVADTGARMVFLANPNNPTGSAFDGAALRAFLRGVPPETVVVYDAAYAEYAADDTSDGLDLIDEFANVIVTRTFSKAYGLAGLRVGWGVARPELADFMNRVRQPFNVNRLAQAAAVAALADQDFAREVVELNRRSLADLREALDGMGLKTYPSQANFVLFQSPVPADELFEALLGEGVIVRSMRGFGLPDHVRVNTGTVAENEFFLSALQRVLARVRP